VLVALVAQPCHGMVDSTAIPVGIFDVESTSTRRLAGYYVELKKEDHTCGSFLDLSTTHTAEECGEKARSMGATHGCPNKYFHWSPSNKKCACAADPCETKMQACGHDEMDLCRDGPAPAGHFDIYKSMEISGHCAEDEMDLCDGAPTLVETGKHCTNFVNMAEVGLFSPAHPDASLEKCSEVILMHGLQHGCSYTQEYFHYNLETGLCGCAKDHCDARTTATNWAVYKQPGWGHVWPVNTAGSCAEDEMDLCEGTCDEEEMDLCKDEVDKTYICHADEMDLCVDDVWHHHQDILEASTCSIDDEMDLCKDEDWRYVELGLCGLDEMDLCGEPTTTTTTTTITTTTTVRRRRTTTMTTTPKPTTTGTAAAAEVTKVAYTGALTIELAGATVAQVETATKKTLAEQFNVAEDAISVTAKKSRRLSQKRLLADAADTWSVDYTIIAEKEKAEQIATKVTELKKAPEKLLPKMKTELKAAGADTAKVDAMKVASFVADEVKYESAAYLVGSVTFYLPFAMADKVEAAVKKALAAVFSVPVDTVTVDAVESRRLSQARRLAAKDPNWSVTFAIATPAEIAAQVSLKMAELASDVSPLAEEIEKKMKAEGISDLVVKVMESVTFTATKAETTKQTTTEPAFETDGSYRKAGLLSIGLAILTSILTETLAA